MDRIFMFLEDSLDIMENIIHHLYILKVKIIGLNITMRKYITIITLV
jgi:hypothetical protein